MRPEHPRRVEKPWGYEEIWAHTDHYVGKLLYIRSHHRLSLQHHETKQETLRVHSGRILLTLEDEHGVLQTRTVGPGTVIHIAPGRKHRFQSLEDCILYEVSTTELEDVIRHDDDYGRT